MTIILTIVFLLAIVIALTGIVGAIVPNIPGPPLCFASMATAYFTCPGYITLNILLWMLGITIVVTVLDFVAPIIMTKLCKGSKYATIGSALGILVGFFFMPLGLVVGPLLGAFAGEIIHGSSLKISIKVAMMSFISFLLSTGLKLIVSIVMTFYTFSAIGHFVLRNIA